MGAGTRAKVRPQPLSWVQRVMQPLDVGSEAWKLLAEAGKGNGIITGLNLEPLLFDQAPSGLLTMAATAGGGAIRNRDRHNVVIPIADDVADERIMILFVNFAQGLGFSVAGYDQRDEKLLTFDRPGPRERSRIHADVILTASKMDGRWCCSRRVDTLLQPYTVQAVGCSGVKQRYFRIYGDLSTGCVPCCGGRARKRHLAEAVFDRFEAFLHAAGVTMFTKRGPPRPFPSEFWFGEPEQVTVDGRVDAIDVEPADETKTDADKPPQVATAPAALHKVRAARGGPVVARDTEGP